MPIHVEKIDATTFKVTVTQDGTTTHTVTAPAAYTARLTAGKVTAETLIAKSFEFLLERESNTSILRSFELSVIERYFPGYERLISATLQNQDK